MKLAPALLCLLLCAASPAAASGVHVVLKVDVAAELADRRDGVMTQTVEIVGRRLAELGVVSPKVSRDGSDRIVADIVGYSDLERLRALLSSARIVSFRLVDGDLGDDDVRAGHVPAGVEIVPPRSGGDPPLAVYRGEIMSGASIRDAKEEHDRDTGLAVVRFTFDDPGKDRFAAFTRENIGKRFAILLDGRVIIAPVILDPIPGGSAEISSDFSEQEASDLAVSLRAGAAPAAWSILELTQTP
jgi:protein-export membrane protein SecD